MIIGSTYPDCVPARLDVDSTPTHMRTYQLQVAIVGVCRDDDAHTILNLHRSEHGC
jgi:hypothetical protein